MVYLMQYLNTSSCSGASCRFICHNRRQHIGWSVRREQPCHPLMTMRLRSEYGKNLTAIDNTDNLICIEPNYWALLVWCVACNKKIWRVCTFIVLILQQTETMWCYLGLIYPRIQISTPEWGTWHVTKYKELFLTTTSIVFLKMSEQKNQNLHNYTNTSTDFF